MIILSSIQWPWCRTAILHRSQLMELFILDFPPRIDSSSTQPHQPHQRLIRFGMQLLRMAAIRRDCVIGNIDDRRPAVIRLSSSQLRGMWLLTLLRFWSAQVSLCTSVWEGQMVARSALTSMRFGIKSRRMPWEPDWRIP